MRFLCSLFFFLIFVAPLPLLPSLLISPFFICIGLQISLGRNHSFKWYTILYLIKSTDKFQAWFVVHSIEHVSNGVFEYKSKKVWGERVMRSWRGEMEEEEECIKVFLKKINKISKIAIETSKIETNY